MGQSRSVKGRGSARMEGARRATGVRADGAPDPQGLPEELSRRETLRSKLDRACAELERRALARADSEQAEYERKVAARYSRLPEPAGEDG